MAAIEGLLVAVGGRMAPAYEHARTFRDEAADALFGQIVEDIEDGYAKSVGGAGKVAAEELGAYLTSG